MGDGDVAGVVDGVFLVFGWEAHFLDGEVAAAFAGDGDIGVGWHGLVVDV